MNWPIAKPCATAISGGKGRLFIPEKAVALRARMMGMMLRREVRVRVWRAVIARREEAMRERRETGKDAIVKAEVGCRRDEK